MAIPKPLPHYTHLFARIDRFHVECPHCLSIILSDVDPRKDPQVHTPGYRRTARRARATPNPRHPYNPYLQQLRCPICARIYFVGLLLWSLDAYDRKLNKPPYDTLPTSRQRAELRQLTFSAWPKVRKHPGESVNIYAGACTCAVDRRDPACPVHGNDPRTGGPL